MFKTRICAYCGVDPVEPYHRVYCEFCYHRFQKLGLAFRRYGKKPMRLRDMHRTWNHWRRTPALDAMYLGDMERAA